MRSRKVVKWLAAAAVGAMMLVPMTASAATWVTYNKAKTPKADATIAPVTLTATYEEKYEGDNTSKTEHTVLSWTAVPEGCTIIFESSADPTFADEDSTEYLSVNKGEEANSTKGVAWLNPGTQYVRAIVYASKIDTATGKEYLAYAASQAVEVTVPAPKALVSSKEVSNTKVHFEFGTEDDIAASGYEVQRKVGKKYQTVAKINGVEFDDKGLEKNKTYEYRIRAYAYNPVTGKTVTGEWYRATVTTWGKALNVQAVATKKNTVKLTWNKVKDADGYEIYRNVGGTSGVSAKFGEKTNFVTGKLIKTINKAKTTKYTDKKLTAGTSYTYTVVAFKNVNGKKVFTVKEEDTVTLDFAFCNLQSVLNSDGSRTLTWDKIVGAEGFMIEKQVEGKWLETTILGATAKGTTLPASAAPDKTDSYRIYAYKGTERVYTETYTTENHSNVNQMPSGITAEQTADGVGVKITWNTVPGAAYYKVYRSTYLGSYNANTGVYEDTSYAPTVRYAYVYTRKENGQDKTNNTWTDKVMANATAAQQSAVDQYVAGAVDPANPDEYVSPINDGPKAGHTYYYYVKAFKANGKEITVQAIKDLPLELLGISYSNTDDEYYDDETYYTPSWTLAPAKITLSKVSLKKPVIKSVQSSKKGEVKISWKKVEGAKAYYVYCSTKKNAKNYMCVGSSTKKNLTVKGLDSGETYYFKVVAAANDAGGADILATKKSDSTVKLSKAKSVKVK